MSDVTATQKQLEVGRDNIVAEQVNIYGSEAATSSPIAALMRRLAEEVKNDSQTQQFIDTLQFFQVRYAPDGIEGLENKLNHAGRTSEIPLAIRQKDLFARLLARHSMFDSAQQIFAYLLARIENDYKCYVLPNIGTLSSAEIDQLINERLVAPCIAEVGAGVFSLNAHIAMGMVYWLAEQCYVRWHA